MGVLQPPYLLAEDDDASSVNQISNMAMHDFIYLQNYETKFTLKRIYLFLEIPENHNEL